MNTFKVFHYEGGDRSLSFSERAYAQWPLGYVEVATLQASCLGEVYDRTQHGGVYGDGAPWTDDPTITLPAQDARALAQAKEAHRGPRPFNSSVALERRSTAVGDVILCDNGAAHGVAGMGFAPLGPVVTSVKHCIAATRARLASGEITGQECYDLITGLQDRREIFEFEAGPVPAR